ncbi:ricin B, lectin domain-containing protein [Artemisia annua]|uniref:Ricin B, lectin domain-containing protein n=1 Tax=Artemisia annua TaxID=35608 RepID=A0A2U1KKD9_ARTAN|nr:ricin B, lectin domain-containing protein [Artemisia annua]
MDPHHHNAPRHRNASQTAAVAVHHVSHQTTHHIPIDYKPAVRFYTKANKDLSLTIRDGKVTLALDNPSDHHQHWIIETFETVKDVFGIPSFALVNKATGQAIKHSTSPGQPIQLVEFNPDKPDVSVLWTKDGVGFHVVRLVNNTRIRLDACIGEHGGVEDGTTVGLWAWTEKANQMWATTPFSGVRFYTKANRDYSLTIRDGKVVLAPTNPSDLYQVHDLVDFFFSSKRFKSVDLPKRFISVDLYTLFEFLVPIDP